MRRFQAKEVRFRFRWVVEPLGSRMAPMPRNFPPILLRTLRRDARLGWRLQGYFADTNTHFPGTVQWACVYGRMEVLGGGGRFLAIKVTLHVGERWLY